MYGWRVEVRVWVERCQEVGRRAGEFGALVWVGRAWGRAETTLSMRLMAEQLLAELLIIRSSVVRGGHSQSSTHTPASNLHCCLAIPHAAENINPPAKTFSRAKSLPATSYLTIGPYRRVHMACVYSSTTVSRHPCRAGHAADSGSGRAKNACTKPSSHPHLP